MSKGDVLIIEDNRDILNAVRLMLENEGFAVIAKEDCITAMNYLMEHKPDVIVTDLMIPEMTGLEFIHQMRRITDYDRIPIIAMSAYDKTYLAAAVAAGAIKGLRKPEDLDILVETVKAALPLIKREQR
ncbi:MAG: response regulator [Blastocatellia bacterium]